MEKQILGLLDEVSSRGGAVAAIEAGFQKVAIEDNAYKIASQVESHERVVVGVNQFTDSKPVKVQTMRIDSSVEDEQLKSLAQLKATRDPVVIDACLHELKVAAAGSDNVMPFIKEALRARATVGEVCEVLRSVWGTYEPVDIF